RCRVLLRRSQGFSSNLSEHGGLVFDRAAQAAFIDGERLDLKNREFRLLEIFLGNLGRVLSKEDISDRLFSLEDAPGPNAIELYVARLRKKIEPSRLRIRTLRGLGYVAELTDEE